VASSALSIGRWRSHNRHMPAKANSGRLSSSANQCVTFGPQNDVAGTKQRHSAFNQPRQYGGSRLRTFVTGAVLRFGGGREPQRIIVSWRSPSGAVRTTGAIMSGNTAGRLGRLPVRSRPTRKRRRMASWLRVMEYRLHVREGSYFSGAGQSRRDNPPLAITIRRTTERHRICFIICILTWWKRW
jgi:hypothetical protein